MNAECISSLCIGLKEIGAGSINRMKDMAVRNVIEGSGSVSCKNVFSSWICLGSILNLMLFLLIFSVFISFEARATEKEMSLSERCSVFEELAFHGEEDILRRWDKKEVRVFLRAGEEYVEYIRSLIDRFGSVTNKNIIYTNESVDVGFVFVDDLYKFALSDGSELFSKWFPNRIDYFDFLRKGAGNDAWYLMVKEDLLETGERVSALGVFGLVKGDHGVNQSRISVALVNFLFPGVKGDMFFEITGGDEEGDLSFLDGKQEVFARMWYSEKVKVGMGKKEVISALCDS